MMRSAALAHKLGLVLISLAFVILPLAGQAEFPPLRGFLAAHDPSTVIKCKDRYYVFYTEQGIHSKSSSDKVFWSPGPAVFTNAPAWTTNAVPGFAGVFWAPDVLFFNNRYYLYYAVSTLGSQVSAIGLVTNPTLDPQDAAYLWTGQGPVIQSGNGSPYNTIDPSFCSDSAGNLWMAFGSYWNGIYLVQLDPATGLRISANSPTYRLAYNSSIEASYLYRRGGYYYLFVNWGSCCSGVNSTYNIRVGRSTSVTGPYRDRAGVDMVNNGGSLFLQGTGKFTGPGHVGILSEGGNQWLSYHYYDANDWAPQYGAYGSSDVALVPLSWTQDDWPAFTNDWSANYNFQAEARDLNGQYSGLLQNGASIRNDPLHGHVLDLNGNNQFVWLPPGAGYGQTFAAVVNWRGGGAWQRIFDFGFDTSRTVMLTPASGDNVLRCDINPGGSVQTVQWTRPLPTNVWTHVALTLDGTEGVLYVNGAAVATNGSMNFLPVNVAPQTNHLGRSKFSADPFFNGQYASFRVYGRALSVAEIAAPLPQINQPQNGGVYWPGSTISFSGEATDFAEVPLGSSNLSWQVEYVQDTRTNLVMGPVSGVSAGSFVVPPDTTGGGTYLVILTATDGVGRQASVTSPLLPANPPSGWSSYYPLQSNAQDVSGRCPGTLNGGASFVNDPVRGNVLNLSGGSQFVSLPAGVSGLQTFMGWVKWNGGGAWQRIFDFGNDTNHYTVLTPSAANGKLRFNISLNSIPGEQIVDAPAALPIGIWTHVAVVMDGRSAVLYTNGVAASSNLFANLVPANLGATNNYFGKSQWPADPYFNGRLSSVRIFSRPLSPGELLAPQVTIAQPGQGGIYQPGDAIPFSGGANDFYDSAISATGLTWTVNFINGASTNAVLGPLSGVSGGTFAIPASGVSASNGFYQIMLAATDAAGRSAIDAVSIFPSSVIGTNSWSSFYPFTASAQDASNRFSGVLLEGASIQSDPIRGNVLNLSGAGQYVSLPTGVGSAQTISSWVKWRGGNAWQRIFDFGQDTQHWFFLTPRDGSGLIQCAITTDATIFNRVMESQAAFPLNQWTYVSLVMNGREGILYLNGTAVAVNNSVNLLPSDVPANHDYLGRSQFSVDPYFNGQLDSLALSSMALPLEEILPGFLQTVITATPGSGGTLNLSWPQWAASMSLYSASNLAPPVLWASVTNQSTSSNGTLTTTISETKGSRFYRLQWP